MRTAWMALLVACGSPARPAVPPADAPPAPTVLGLGRDAPADLLRAWDRDVDPTGAGLPPGSGTAALGRELYARKCAACHGRAGEGASAPILIATEPKSGFAEDYKLPRTMGNWWPHATTAFDYIQRAMPQNAPGSLPADEVYALVAFLLAENAVVSQDFVADAASLPQVRMPTRVEFVDDDRDEAVEFR